jgi:hypothetical protein
MEVTDLQALPKVFFFHQLYHQTGPIMPKTASKKGNAARSSPYSPGASKAKAANNIFKMNTDLG